MVLPEEWKRPSGQCISEQAWLLFVAVYQGEDIVLLSGKPF